MEKELFFKNGAFRIMLVGDPHADDSVAAPHDADVVKDYLDLQYAAVAAAKPDLVILMGDNAAADTAEGIRETLMRITAPYTENGIPFSFILGNHDLQSAVSDRAALYELYRTLPGCLMPEEISPDGDFSFPVYDSKKERAALNLLLVYSGDSAGRAYYSKYDFVKPRQLEWIRQTQAAAAANGQKTPGVLFQHIPVPEEFALTKPASALSLLWDGVQGQDERSRRFFRKRKGVEGFLGEAPCAPSYPSGEFAAMKESAVFAAFFGHDHLNDFVGMTDGVILGQCKLASFNAYGDGLRQGVRILDFREDAPFCLDTEMLYYRDLVGRRCRSISPYLQMFHDRTNMKLETSLKIGGALAAIGLPIALIAKLRK